MLFGFTRQSYYEHKQRARNSQMQEVFILTLVNEIRKDHPKMGTVKLHKLLEDDFQKHQIKYGRDKLYNLLGEHGMLIKQGKYRPQTTMSNHFYRRYPNLIRDMELRRSNKLWVSDITYLRTKMGFVYLSLITDAYSKKIVGWCLWPNLSSQGALNALEMAVNIEKPYETITHHSDRGVQYCCNDYVNYLKSSEINISMTENGDPYENAIAERVNGILKHEYDLKQTFSDYLTANEIVKQAVSKYNNERPHASCDYMTPIKAHTFEGDLKKHWKKKKYKDFQAQSNLTE